MFRGHLLPALHFSSSFRGFAFVLAYLYTGGVFIFRANFCVLLLFSVLFFYVNVSIGHFCLLLPGLAGFPDDTLSIPCAGCLHLRGSRGFAGARMGGLFNRGTSLPRDPSKAELLYVFFFVSRHQKPVCLFLVRSGVRYDYHHFGFRLRSVLPGQCCRSCSKSRPGRFAGSLRRARLYNAFLSRAMLLPTWFCFTRAAP